MSVRIITGTTGASTVAVIYDSVTDQALGPIFFEPEESFDFGDQEDISDAEGVAVAFLEYLGTEGIPDARTLSFAELHDQHDAFLRFLDPGRARELQEDATSKT